MQDTLGKIANSKPIRVIHPNVRTAARAVETPPISGTFGDYMYVHIRKLYPFFFRAPVHFKWLVYATESCCVDVVVVKCVHVSWV